MRDSSSTLRWTFCIILNCQNYHKSNINRDWKRNKRPLMNVSLPTMPTSSIDRLTKCLSRCLYRARIALLDPQCKFLTVCVLWTKRLLIVSGRLVMRCTTVDSLQFPADHVQCRSIRPRFVYKWKQQSLAHICSWYF